MDKSTPGVSWRGNTASSSSGRFSETVIDREHRKFPEETRHNSELVLMKLRRLSMGLMSKNERFRYSGRKLCKSNVFQFLKHNLSHSSEKVRYLALEVLCFTVVRLGTKTDSLLKTILPKVIQCLRENEEKDIKRKALHFLRVYFHHTKSLSGFLEDFVQIGIENEDPSIRNACFYGLNIIFDQDIGSCLFSLLVVSVVNHIRDGDLNIVAYRALKHVHQTIGDDRFFELLTLANQECVSTYMNIYDYEKSDALLSMEENNCTSVVSTYIMKRTHMGFKKDFGILDRSYLNHVLETRNCERAKAVEYLNTALKETLWTDADLEPQLDDFLKVINCFIDNSNRLIQIYGFNILKETISRMGFMLSPHIRFIVKMLRHALTSANSKIKYKTEKILHKLMRNIHVMTVTWELLDTRDKSEKESVLILLQNKIKQFPYHELDMIPLCNFLGQSLEDENSSIARHSRTCISQLLDIMREYPIYGNRTEALKIILRNYHLNRETLKDIDALELCGEDNLEGSESCSDHELIKEVIEDATFDNSELSAAEEILTSIHPYDRRRYHASDGYHSELRIDSGKSRWNNFATPESTERSNHLKLNGKSNQDFLEHFQIKRLLFDNNPSPLEYSCKRNFKFSVNSMDIEQEKMGISRDPNSRNKQRTRFCMKTDTADVNQICPQNEMARGDAGATSSSASLSKTRDKTEEEHIKFVTESYEQDGIQVDVLRKDIFNFNIMKVEHSHNIDGIEEVDLDYQECKNPVSSSLLNTNSIKGTGQTSFTETDIVASVPTVTSPPMSETSSIKSNIALPSPVSNEISHSHDTVTISCKSLANIIPLIASNIKTNEFNQAKEFSTKLNKFAGKNPSEWDVNSSSFVQKHLKINFCNDSHNNILLGKLIQTKTKSKTIDGSNIEINNDNAHKNSENAHASTTAEQYDFLRNKTIDHNSLLLGNSQTLPDMEVTEKDCVLSCNKFDETETPFLPKSKQLPRTPVEKNPDYSLDVQPKVSKNRKRLAVGIKRNKTRTKTHDKIDGSSESNLEESTKLSTHQSNIESKQSEMGALLRQNYYSKHNSALNWGECQWRRDLDYAAKATTCSWTDKFEEMIKSIGPFPSPDAAENEMKKAVEDLFSGTWTVKEDAMLKVIRLAKHHQILVSEDTSKIALALSNEIKNFRQSVAGKAILTTGYLYEMMGKQFENKLRLIVSALLVKSGTRTLAAYYRLVVRSLVKIVAATSPLKAAIAFIQEGSKQANKAARETAAQFLCVLTENLGVENSMVPTLSSHILKCAAVFVFDSSALTRYCGKRMFQILMQHPDFEKQKNYNLEVNLVQDLDKILDQLRTKGVKNEILPIHLIE